MLFGYDTFSRPSLPRKGGGSATAHLPLPLRDVNCELSKYSTDIDARNDRQRKRRVIAALSDPPGGGGKCAAIELAAR
jgi:hypothetical protein